MRIAKFSSPTCSLTLPKPCESLFFEFLMLSINKRRRHKFLNGICRGGKIYPSPDFEFMTYGNPFFSLLIHVVICE